MGSEQAAMMDNRVEGLLWDDNMSAATFDDGATNSSSSSSGSGGVETGLAGLRVNVKFEFVVHGILLTSACFAGMVTNALCLVVMSQPSLKKGRGSSVNALLTSMAAVDLLVLISSLLMCGLPGLTDYLIFEAQYTNWLLDCLTSAFPHMTPFVYPMGLVAQTASVYLTVVVTIERYIVVCWPLKARSLCTKKRARVSVIAVCLFSLVYNTTRFMEYDNRTVLVTTPRAAAKSGSNPSFGSSAPDLATRENSSSLGVFNSTFNESGLSTTMSESLLPSVVLQDNSVANSSFAARDEYSMGFETETHTRLVTTPLRSNPIYITVYINWLYLIVMYVIPFLLLLMMNWRIAIEIHRARIRRSSMAQVPNVEKSSGQQVTLNIRAGSTHSSRLVRVNQGSSVSRKNSREHHMNGKALEDQRSSFMSASNTATSPQPPHPAPDASRLSMLRTYVQRAGRNMQGSMTLSKRNVDGDPSYPSPLENRRERQEEREQQNLAVMLMVVVLVFVLCNVLAMVSNVLEAFKVEALELTQVSNLLVTLNSSVNLFIYCGFGERFRNELKRVFRNSWISLVRHFSRISPEGLRAGRRHNSEDKLNWSNPARSYCLRTQNFQCSGRNRGHRINDDFAVNNNRSMMALLRHHHRCSEANVRQSILTATFRRNTVDIKTSDISSHHLSSDHSGHHQPWYSSEERSARSEASEDRMRLAGSSVSLSAFRRAKHSDRAIWLKKRTLAAGTSSSPTPGAGYSCCACEGANKATNHHKVCCVFCRGQFRQRRRHSNSHQLFKRLFKRAKSSPRMRHRRSMDVVELSQYWSENQQGARDLDNRFNGANFKTLLLSSLDGRSLGRGDDLSEAAAKAAAAAAAAAAAGSAADLVGVPTDPGTLRHLKSRLLTRKSKSVHLPRSISAEASIHGAATFSSYKLTRRRLPRRRLPTCSREKYFRNGRCIRNDPVDQAGLPDSRGDDDDDGGGGGGDHGSAANVEAKCVQNQRPETIVVETRLARATPTGRIPSPGEPAKVGGPLAPPEAGSQPVARRPQPPKSAIVQRRLMISYVSSSSFSYPKHLQHCPMAPVVVGSSRPQRHQGPHIPVTERLI